MKVRDLMVRRVATVRPDDSLATAGRTMDGRSCGCVAVVDDEFRVVAVLTDRDLCMAATRSDARLSELDVESAMSRTVVTCQSDDDVARAEQVMGRHQVRRLPVVDAEGRLEGIVSLDDIAREARRERDLIAPPVTAEGVGRSLGEIGRPHLLGGT